MKYTATLVAALATLAILVGQSESAFLRPNYKDTIPVEILKALIEAPRPPLVNFDGLIEGSVPETRISFNISSPGFNPVI